MIAPSFYWRNSDYSYLAHALLSLPTSVGREHYEMMGSVCLSVGLSIACLDLTRGRYDKAYRKPKLNLLHTFEYE